MKATDDLLLTCSVCGREFRGRRAPQAHGAHKASHARENGTPKPKRKYAKRASADFMADLKVAPMVQQLFPKGIPTDDPVALVRDLKLIVDLRERFVR